MTPEPGCDPCTRIAPPGVAEGFRAEWRTEAVIGLARGIQADRAFERLPILADALEEAGCTDERILCHCREPNTHARRCWAMRLALDQYLPPPGLPSPPVPELPVVAAVPLRAVIPQQEGESEPFGPPRNVVVGCVGAVWGGFAVLSWLCGGGTTPQPAPRWVAPVRAEPTAPPFVFDLAPSNPLAPSVPWTVSAEEMRRWLKHPALAPQPAAPEKNPALPGR